MNSIGKRRTELNCFHLYRPFAGLILSVFLLTVFSGAAPVRAEDARDTGTKAVTLMIYMTGSDLESNAAAATNDMQEIADSDLDAVAGGFLRKIDSKKQAFGSDNNGDN